MLQTQLPTDLEEEAPTINKKRRGRKPSASQAVLSLASDDGETIPSTPINTPPPTQAQCMYIVLCVILYNYDYNTKLAEDRPVSPVVAQQEHVETSRPPKRKRTSVKPGITMMISSL